MGEREAHRRRISGKWFSRIIEQIDTAPEREALSGRILEIRECIEADHVLFAMLIPVSLADPRITLFTDYSPCWLQRYRERRYIDFDPVVEQAKRSTLPIIWSELEGQTEAQSAMMADAAAHGLHEGITFSVRGPLGDIGLLNFAYRRPQRKLRSRMAYLSPFLQLLTHHIHNTATRLWRFDNTPPLSPPAPRTLSLNPRELECLLWVAEGKTTWEIGQILRIAESTVNTHITRATQKLNANNRSHAITRAIAEGYIAPSPRLDEFTQIHYIPSRDERL